MSDKTLDEIQRLIAAIQQLNESAHRILKEIDKQQRETHHTETSTSESNDE